MKTMKASAHLLGVMMPAMIDDEGEVRILGVDTVGRFVGVSPPQTLIERAGRICYKSEDKITIDSCAAFIEKVCLQLGHESISEHSHISFHCIMDRGVSHEAVRHRLCGFSQESTRYCNYGQEKFGRQITVIEPPGLNTIQRAIWETGMLIAERTYLELLDSDVPAQIARAVLPTCLKTELIWTANFREWKHIRRLRKSLKAHPSMQELMSFIDPILVKIAPTYFKAAA